MVAAMFRYWKGTMKFRFQVVASQYHRGKAVIFYEPNFEAQSLLPTTTEIDFAKHLCVIVDLEELDNTEIEVPWGIARTFAETNGFHQRPAATGINYFPNPQTPAAVLLSSRARDANGFLEIRVVNELASATDPPTDIYINVFVSCGDLEVAVPQEISVENWTATPAILPASLPFPEGEINETGGFDTTPSGTSHFLTHPCEACKDDTQVFFGESIRSWRSLMKRYTQAYFWTVIAPVSATTKGVRSLEIPLYPYFSLYNRASVTGITYPGVLDLFTYLRYCYVGARGGYRYAINTDSDSSEINGVSVTRYFGASAVPSVASFGVPTVDISPATSFAGTHVFQRETNNAMMFEIPYYSSNRFYLSSTSPDDMIPTQTLSGSNFDQGFNSTNDIPSAQLRLVVNPRDSDNQPDYYVNVNSAAADDFSFVNFVAACPRFLA